MMNSLDMPQEVSCCSFSGSIEFYVITFLLQFVSTVLLEKLILLSQIGVNFELNLLSRGVYHLYELNRLNRNLPFKGLLLIKIYSLGLLVKGALGVIQKDHGKYEETWLFAIVTILLNNKAMELVTIRILDGETGFKEKLP